MFLSIYSKLYYLKVSVTFFVIRELYIFQIFSDKNQQDLNNNYSFMKYVRHKTDKGKFSIYKKELQK